MAISIEGIDGGRPFDFGRTSGDYALYRDIYPKSLRDKLVALGAVAQGMDILDVGTGTGVIPRLLHDTGARFTGIDIAPEQIEYAVKASPRDIRLIVSPAEKTPFADESFDAVIACQCFWYLPLLPFIGEVLRILLPGGRLLLISMAWLPDESRIAGDTEKLVLKYNPKWNGGGFKPCQYRFPAWAEQNFMLETYHHYCESIPFTSESWRGRMRTCRGVAASLPAARVAAFDRELADYLAANTTGEFSIMHYIEIANYRLKMPFISE